MTSPVASDAPKLMPDLFEMPVLRSYLSSVRDWHGYIRFLGLPDRRDNPDVLIDRLFVDPLLTRRHVSPDESPRRWIKQAETVTSALGAGKPLVLLGDPGAGKSTLVNYVVWLLAQPGSNAVVDRLGWRLPIPMVLRELKLRGVTDFDGLIDAFLAHTMSGPLRGGDYLQRALSDGLAFVVLDGIDEIGGRGAREDLRRAVFDGLERYPGCSWMLTSRIVGYYDAPFDVSSANIRGTDMLLDAPRSDDDGPIATRYIAPFDDERIAAFSRRWYIQRVAGEGRAEAEAADLVKAIHADEAILRLARVPNLLTMMALIHRVEATLPHGRALLYDRIAEAYLESIDKFRGIYSGAVDLPRKKHWLARIAYEMQRRRASESSQQESNILVDAEEVIQWLGDAMERSGAASGVKSAREFLDYVGRRSGLFLPRSDKRYAFVHLSFQEYFAAVAMEREVTGISWARDEQSPLGLDRSTIREWGTQNVWRETLVFLFELLSAKEDWHDDLLSCVFGADFRGLESATVGDEEAMNLARLLARLAVNQQSGLPLVKRRDAVASCVRAELQHNPGSGKRDRSSGVFTGLLGEDARWNRDVVDVIVREASVLDVNNIDLSGTRLRELDCIGTLSAIQELKLSHTQVEDVSPLRGMVSLESLELDGTLVVDVAPLAELVSLVNLDLSRTNVSEIEPLSKLIELRYLHLLSTEVSDIGALEELRQLEYLSLADTEVSDLGALSGLVGLERLILMGRRITDVSPLRRLGALEHLYLVDTAVTNLAPVAELKALTHLNLSGTVVTDVAPIAEIATLEHLDLGATEVRDIAPLAKLKALNRLLMYGSRVESLAPLAEIPSLKSVFLGEEYEEGEVDALRSALPDCEIRAAP